MAVASAALPDTARTGAHGARRRGADGGHGSGLHRQSTVETTAHPSGNSGCDGAGARVPAADAGAGDDDDESADAVHQAGTACARCRVRARLCLTPSHRHTPTHKALTHTRRSRTQLVPDCAPAGGASACLRGRATRWTSTGSRSWWPTVSPASSRSAHCMWASSTAWTFPPSWTSTASTRQVRVCVCLCGPSCGMGCTAGSRAAGACMQALAHCFRLPVAVCTVPQGKLWARLRVPSVVQAYYGLCRWQRCRLPFPGSPSWWGRDLGDRSAVQA